MKKIVLGILVALLLVGCGPITELSNVGPIAEFTKKTSNAISNIGQQSTGVKEQSKEEIKEEPRLSKIEYQYWGDSMDYTIIKDNKTGQEYLVVRYLNDGGLDVIPLEDITNQTENK